MTDQEVLPLIEATMDRSNPREWYYALFDYGAMLKTRTKINRKSVHYHKQGAFTGSNREIRGRILKLMLARTSIPRHELIAEMRGDYRQVLDNVEQLQTEGFLVCDGDTDTLSIA